MVEFLELMITTTTGFIIGGLWYSKFMFQKPWMKELKIDPKSVEIINQKEIGMVMSLAFIKTIILAFVFILLIELLNFTTLQEIIKLGVLLWIGFIVTIMLDGIIFEKKSKKLFFINVMHYFVVIIFMSICIYTL